MSENIIHKTCVDCKQSKPTNQFYPRRLCCKTCNYYRNKQTPHYKNTTRWRWLYQSAKKRKIKFSLTLKDVKELFENVSQCPYCKQTITKFSVDRKDNGLGYSKENCIVICSDCNSIKGDKGKLIILEIYKHLFGDLKPSDIEQL